MPKHIVLLGDSVFDNAAYTRGLPDVATHLRAALPQHHVTLCAVDGSTAADIPAQLARAPASATDLVLSVGGNDALLNYDLLDASVRSTGEALELLRDRLERFAADYARAVAVLVERRRHAVVCTIYNGGFDGDEAARVRVAVALFDDVIMRTALQRGADVIELRLVCRLEEDYANPIEPSGVGGLRIARAIVAAVGAGDGPERRMTVTG